MNEKDFPFTYKSLENQYKYGISLGYKFITCHEYFLKKSNLDKLTVVNRIDVDCSLKKAEKIRKIFKKLKIKGTFFIRLHAKEYNPFSFENFRIVKLLLEDGHELGYHSEIIDQSKIWGISPSECLKKDIEIINSMFGVQIKGVASHNGPTLSNNLDFWNDHDPIDFGLLYEAYDNNKFNLFNNSLYISDSEWINWKAYDKGKLLAKNTLNLKEHLKHMHPLVYLLIHPDTYYDLHIYE